MHYVAGPCPRHTTGGQASGDTAYHDSAATPYASPSGLSCTAFM